ncbi:MAG: cation:dicarboxylase symporter family transporter, partial [Simkaniaceae bacterium]|nr:cation:dicarboxylase symporter family transporter [Simkaniaceae bacterium]
MFRKSQWLILLAFLFGGIAAYFPMAPLHHAISLVAELFLKALKLISLPVIFLSIVSTITKIKNPQVTRILAGKVLKYTIFTTLIAASVGLLLFIVFHHDANAVTTATNSTAHSYLDTIRAIIPSNIVEPFLENNVLGVAFLATILSLALIKVESKDKETVTSFFHALFQSMLKISSFFITLLPIGIFAFTYEFFHSLASNDYDLQKIGYYTICVLGANLIQGCIILPMILKRKGISPIHAFKKMSPALAVAFFSKSSNAALPLTLERATKGLGVKDETAQFSIPLCSVINMNGCAAFILITTLFVATSEGMAFSLPTLLAWI